MIWDFQLYHVLVIKWSLGIYFPTILKVVARSCILKHRCFAAEMFYSADARHERFWRVGIARNAVFFHSFGKVSSDKRSGAEDRLWKMSTKFAPRCGAKAIRKSKSLKRGRLGALFEVEIRKICTALWREGDFEAKIVKKWQRRDTFGSSASENLHHAVARERFGSQNR